jgi:hypothetical protein
MEDIYSLIEEFKANQSLTALQAIKNAGLELKEIRGGSWQRLEEFNLPIRFVVLYDKAASGIFVPVALGSY